MFKSYKYVSFVLKAFRLFTKTLNTLPHHTYKYDIVSLVVSRAQLFEDRLALNPGLNLTRVSFFLCSKEFSRIIFSVIFRASNHQLVDKRN